MSKDKGYIYKITNKINNLVYVGCTINSLEKRFYEHIYRCFKTDYQSKLYNSMKKYGVENFCIELIEECELSKIYTREKEMITIFNSYENGLNSTFGGEGCLGYTHSPEIRKKISESVKNGNSHKGKTYEELYGDKAEEEKLKRKLKVSEKWGSMTEEDKSKRLKNLQNAVLENSKFGIETLKKVKENLNNGLSVKKVKELYPEISLGYIYAIKNNRRCKNL